MQYLPFWEWLISLSIVSSRFLHAVTYGRISFFLRLNNIPFMYILHFVYPLICQWTLRLFPHLSSCEWCCHEHGVLVSLWGPGFNSFGGILKSAITGSYGSSMFNFMRTLCAVFHGGHTHSCSCRQGVRVLVSHGPLLIAPLIPSSVFWWQSAWAGGSPQLTAWRAICVFIQSVHSHTIFMESIGASPVLWHPCLQGAYVSCGQ